MIRIFSIQQHSFIIVRFQENGIALREPVRYIIACITDICKNAHLNTICRNNETMRVSSIMMLWKCMYLHLSYFNRLIWIEGMNQLRLKLQSAVHSSTFSNVNRELIFF